jgi:hypothetical protein
MQRLQRFTAHTPGHVGRDQQKAKGRRHRKRSTAN